ncbi:DNA polymerase III subunit gamma/tau [Candidatus Saccharibacteria bacterium]|nr:DNA polymerase III subunit gamma/tau [Candidatus Saccharibacteria bacterium]
MGVALYRKYRSRGLSELVGQEHIVTTLQNALKSGKISHAYLFTGPRGTGKTSVARILAHEVNGLPYSTDSNLDIIEIDAASNRRIDEIRDLREKVSVAPASAKYKVYIIDEVHMLTREAFNALLKTLEEPPAHVIFILATTDAHKLPETIISRTQRFTFKPAPPGPLTKHLASIAKAEKIDIDADALQLLAQHGGGSYRDSVSLLDQMGSLGVPVNAEVVRQQLGLPSSQAIDDIISSLQSGNLSAPVVTLQQLYDSGLRASSIASGLAARLRTDLAADTPTLSASDTLKLLAQLLLVDSSPQPERFLELVLMEPLSGSAPAPAPVEPKPAAAKAKPEPAVEAKPEPAVEPKPEPKTPTPQKEAEPEKPMPTAGSAALDESAWPKVLASLKKQYNTIYGIARMAQVDFSEPGKVTLVFTFAFHQKRLHDAKNRQILANAIYEVTGQKPEIVIKHDKDARPTPAPAVVATPEPAKSDALADVSAIFGGGQAL